MSVKQTPENVPAASVGTGRLVLQYRSAVSGLWYINPHAAGKINAVKIGGQILERMDGEKTMPWIRRVAQWALSINPPNVRG